MGKKSNVIELQPLVACLKGQEHISPGPLVRKLTRRFYHKSGSELRLEQEQKIKLLNMPSLNYGS